METTCTRKPKVDHGKNVERLCEILGVTDEKLAEMLDVDLETTKQYKESETLPDDVIEDIAQVLNIPSAIIKKMGDENMNVNIQNNYEGSNSNASQVAVQNHTFIMNPFEKVVELYDRLLKTKDEQITILEKKLNEK